MSLWSSRRVREDTMLACPECGRMFVPRGLAAHRRMRHGPGSPPETDPGTKSGAMDTVAIARALDDLARAVGQLDARIDRLLDSRMDPLLAAPEPAPALPTRSASTPSAKESLERELDALLAEIARVRTEGVGALVQASEGEAATEHELRLRLGKLRRRQTSILSRLREIDGDPGAEELDCL